MSERNQRFAVCQCCESDVSRGGLTVKTFNTAEKNAWKDPKETGMKQISLVETEARSKAWDINDPRAIRVHHKIAGMMALDFQPYSIVSDTGFTELLKTLEPRYTLPSHHYFTEDVVPGIASAINSKLVVVLKDVTCFSLTTDAWSTSLTNQSLISLTAHWLEDSFVRKSAVLHAKHLDGSHLGEKICENIKSMIEY